MMTNGTEKSKQKNSNTQEGYVFNEYVNAFVRKSDEKGNTTSTKKTTVVNESFQEYYY